MNEHTFDPASSAESLADSPPTDLMERVVEQDEFVAGVRLMRLSAVAALDRTREFEVDGYTSTSAFLMHRLTMNASEANREVFLARSLDQMPYAVKAAWAGRIGIGQLETLARGRSRHPDEYPADEASLVEAVSGLSAADTRRVVDYWVQSHDDTPSHADEEEAASRMWMSRTWKGRWRLDGDLDPVTGSLLDTALDQLMSQIVESTDPAHLTPAPQRRADAAAEMARRFLDSVDAPTDHGNRPHLMVHVNWETLAGATRAGMCELDNGSVITPETARLLACDATVCRLLTGPAGEILDLGRLRRTISPAQYRALCARDRHCRWPGCSRPASWCDGHHILHWLNGGETNLGNLILLCRHHHSLIHQHGWELTGTPEEPTFIRPDGTVLANAPPR